MLISDTPYLMINTREETGIYALLTEPNDEDDKIVLSILITGRVTNIKLSLRTVVNNGAILTQLTRQLNIANIPGEFALHQNYPNPFNRTTTIEYNLPVDA